MGTWLLLWWISLSKSRSLGFAAWCWLCSCSSSAASVLKGGFKWSLYIPKWALICKVKGKITVKEWAKKELGTADPNPGLAAGIMVKYYQLYGTGSGGLSQESLWICSQCSRVVWSGLPKMVMKSVEYPHAILNLRIKLALLNYCPSKKAKVELYIWGKQY